jgi:hypothetical protein
MEGVSLLCACAVGLALALLIFAGWKLRRAAFLCLLASLVLSAASAEWALRYLGVGEPGRPQWVEPMRRGPPTESAYWPGGEMVYSYPTDPRGYFDAERRVVGRVNALGLRGPECRLQPEQGRTRIALLGDSFALGIGVRDEHTLSAQLEQALGPAEHEVLNFGVSATQTKEQVDYLEGYVLRFRPQVVVLLYFLNDAERDSTLGYLSQPRTWAALRKHSHLANALIAALERGTLRRQMREHYLAGYAEDSQAWIDVRAELDRAARLLSERGITFCIAIHPVLVDLQPGRYPFEGIHGQIQAFCSGRGIAVLDLYTALAGLRDRDLWVHPNDQHPNEESNRRTSVLLAEDLRRLLAPSPVSR